MCLGALVCGCLGVWVPGCVDARERLVRVPGCACGGCLNGGCLGGGCQGGGCPSARVAGAWVYIYSLEYCIVSLDKGLRCTKTYLIILLINIVISILRLTTGSKTKSNS